MTNSNIIDFSPIAAKLPINPTKWDIIPIHSTDRATFKFCRRQWVWSSPSHLNLIPKASVLGINKNFWFGSGIHHALEKYYHPGLREDPWIAFETWFDLQWRGGVVSESEVKAFADREPKPVLDLSTGQPDGSYRVEGLVDILPDTHLREDEFLGLKDLGIGMMKFYKDYAEANDNFSVILVEHDFSVPVLDSKGAPMYAVDNRIMPDWWEPNFDDGNEFGPYMKIDVGDYTDEIKKQVHVRGKQDLIVQDNEYGRYGIWDHKAQPLDEPIATPDGFKLMGELKPGDNVIGSNGLSTRIVDVFPQGKLHCYKVTFSDKSYTYCSPEHLWTTFSNSQEAYKKPKVRTLQQIANLTTKFSIPVTDPIQFNKRNLLIEPYLMGCLLGDGYLAGTCVVLSCAEPEIIENIKSLGLPQGVEVYKYSGNNFSYGIAAKNKVLVGSSELEITRNSLHNPVLDALKEYHLHTLLSDEKFVPEDYLFSSIEDRLQLLRGLLDTDGNCYKGKVSFVSTSYKLAKAVQYLTRSLGGISRLWNVQGTIKPAYKVSVKLPDNIAPFNLTRKYNQWLESRAYNHHPLTRYIESIEYTGEREMQCIQVKAENGLYLTRDFIVTHNTTSRLDDDYFRHLELDEQCTSYLAFGELEARIHGLEFKNLDSIMYQAILKGYPKPPTTLQNGMPSLARSTETTTAKLFEKYIEENGLKPIFDVDTKMQNYYAWLLETGDERFINRTQTWRNSTQRKNAMIRLRAEAEDMLSPTMSAYPNPTKNYGCVNCIFRVPCIMAEDGSDYLRTLEDGYMPNWDR